MQEPIYPQILFYTSETYETIERLRVLHRQEFNLKIPIKSSRISAVLQVEHTTKPNASTYFSLDSVYTSETHPTPEK
jgi:hypothetical protein